MQVKQHICDWLNITIATYQWINQPQKKPAKFHHCRTLMHFIRKFWFENGSEKPSGSQKKNNRPKIRIELKSSAQRSADPCHCCCWKTRAMAWGDGRGQEFSPLAWVDSHQATKLLPSSLHLHTTPFDNTHTYMSVALHPSSVLPQGAAHWPTFPSSTQTSRRRKELMSDFQSGRQQESVAPVSALKKNTYILCLSKN